jgi:hypothetical protein
MLWDRVEAELDRAAAAARERLRAETAEAVLCAAVLVALPNGEVDAPRPEPSTEAVAVDARAMPTEPPRYYELPTAARRLGVSVRTLLAWIADEPFVFQFGTRRRLEATGFERWLEDHRRRPHKRK